MCLFIDSTMLVNEKQHVSTALSVRMLWQIGIETSHSLSKYGTPFEKLHKGQDDVVYIAAFWL